MTNSVFEEARKKRVEMQQEAEQKRNNTYTSFDSDPIKYMGLESKKEKVFRIVGNPAEVRKEHTSDAKIILYSEILNDKGSSFVKTTWPMVQKGDKFVPDPEWFLTRVYDAINAGKWEKFTEDMVDNEKVFVKSGKIVSKFGKEVYWHNYHNDKMCYKRIQKENNRTEKQQFDREVYPKPRVLMNVIDRHDSWCEDNSHTKVLVSKITPYTFQNDKGESQTINYIDRGVPLTLYTGIWENVIDPRGHWDLDVIILKTGNKNPAYIIRDSLEDKISVESKTLARRTPMTDKEKLYGFYDFDDLYKPTSYYKIDKDMSKLIKLVDLELEEHFEEELKELVFEEAKKRQENSKEDKEVYSVSVSEALGINDEKKSLSEESKPVETKVEIKEEPKTERRSRETKVEEVKTVSVDNLQFWGSLDVDDQDDVRKGMTSFDGGDIKWKTDCITIPCDECRKPLPKTVMHCPYCGRNFN